jgi:hypothetical protein
MVTLRKCLRDHIRLMYPHATMKASPNLSPQLCRCHLWSTTSCPAASRIPGYCPTQYYITMVQGHHLRNALILAKGAHIVDTAEQGHHHLKGNPGKVQIPFMKSLSWPWPRVRVGRPYCPTIRSNPCTHIHHRSSPSLLRSPVQSLSMFIHLTTGAHGPNPVVSIAKYTQHIYLIEF